MSNRLRYLLLILIILVNAAALPGQVSEIEAHWPVIRLWSDAEEQMKVMLGDVPYESLITAAEQLAPDVTVLLVTSGEDVRIREYTTYHRALYLLAPRPVWWLSPAPSDGTWESRWWISRPLTAENIAAVVADKSADCLLLIGVPSQPDYGRPVSQLPDGVIIQTGSKDCLAATPSPVVNYPVSLWPLRLLAALLVVLAFGFGFLALADRFWVRIGGLEAIALAWLLGAGLLSTFIFWLDGLGLSLDNQVGVLTALAALLTFWHRRFIFRSLASIQFSVPSFRFDNNRLAQTAVLLLVAFLIFQLVFVVLMAVGRPLTIWDSWVNWGSKGRTIFLENGITPALYADPSREVMLLGYPLSIPLQEAWLYGWLGAADDRLVGVLFVLTYLAIGGFVYGFCRRRGLAGKSALLMMGAAVSLGHIAGLAATAFTDLWLPVLLLVSAVYLLEWLQNGRTGHLLVAAVTAGLLTWVKQEGLILVFVLLVSLLLTFLLWQAGKKWQFRRLLAAGTFIGLSAIIFGGPWRLFTAREAVLVSVFMPLTVDNLLAHLDRAPVILRFVGMELLNPRSGFIWPLILVVLVARRSQLGQIIRRPSVLLLLVPVLYLSIMSIPYLFSEFVPVRQHILSSFFRINAHVLSLLLLWLGFKRRQISMNASK